MPVAPEAPVLDSLPAPAADFRASSSSSDSSDPPVELSFIDFSPPVADFGASLSSSASSSSDALSLAPVADFGPVAPALLLPVALFCFSSLAPVVDFGGSSDPPDAAFGACRLLSPPVALFLSPSPTPVILSASSSSSSSPLSLALPVDEPVAPVPLLLPSSEATVAGSSVFVTPFTMIIGATWYLLPLETFNAVPLKTCTKSNLRTFCSIRDAWALSKTVTLNGTRMPPPSQPFTQESIFFSTTSTVFRSTFNASAIDFSNTSWLNSSFTTGFKCTTA